MKERIKIFISKLFQNKTKTKEVERPKVIALCIDASNKPKEIPNELWLEYEKEYEVIGVHNTQSGIALALKELNLEDAKIESNGLYFRGYNIERFVLEVGIIELAFFRNILNNPLTPKYLTKKELSLLEKDAVENGNFELAAKYRDEQKTIK